MPDDDSPRPSRKRGTTGARPEFFSQPEAPLPDSQAPSFAEYLRQRVKWQAVGLVRDIHEASLPEQGRQSPSVSGLWCSTLPDSEFLWNLPEQPTTTEVALEEAIDRELARLDTAAFSKNEQLLVVVHVIAPGGSSSFNVHPVFGSRKDAIEGYKSSCPGMPVPTGLPPPRFDPSRASPVLNHVRSGKRRHRFLTVVHGETRLLRSLRLSPETTGEPSNELAVCPPEQLLDVLDLLTPTLSKPGAAIAVALTTLPKEWQRRWMRNTAHHQLQVAVKAALEAIDLRDEAMPETPRRLRCDLVLETLGVARDEMVAYIEERLSLLAGHRFDDDYAAKRKFTADLQQMLDMLGCRVTSPDLGVAQPAILRCRSTTGAEDGTFQLEFRELDKTTGAWTRKTAGGGTELPRLELVDRPPTKLRTHH